MRNELVPCPGCNRHVRVVDAVCPFCDAVVGARPSPVVVGRLRSRSAMMMFGASIAVSGCGGAAGTPETPPDAPADGTSDPDTAGPDNPDGANPEDPGTVVAMYGAPAPEELPPDGPDDEGGMGTKYGAPPPPPPEE